MASSMNLKKTIFYIGLPPGRKRGGFFTCCGPEQFYFMQEMCQKYLPSYGSHFSLGASKVDGEKKNFLVCKFLRPSSIEGL